MRQGLEDNVFNLTVKVLHFSHQLRLFLLVNKSLLDRKNMTIKTVERSNHMNSHLGLVPGAGFEPATSGHRALGHRCSPDYESGALARLGYPGLIFFSCRLKHMANYLSFSTA